MYELTSTLILSTLTWTLLTSMPAGSSNLERSTFFQKFFISSKLSPLDDSMTRSDLKTQKQRKYDFNLEIFEFETKLRLIKKHPNKCQMVKVCILSTLMIKSHHI